MGRSRTCRWPPLILCGLLQAGGRRIPKPQLRQGQLPKRCYWPQGYTRPDAQRSPVLRDYLGGLQAASNPLDPFGQLHHADDRALGASVDRAVKPFDFVLCVTKFVGDQ